MDKHEYRQILIAKLCLDLDNPRHDVLSHEGDVIRALLERDGDKLLRLAHDIVNEGTNPADLPIVVPHPIIPESYVVVEGNRRLAAIKILTAPGQVNFGSMTSLQHRFEELAKEFASTKFDAIECVVFENRPEANHWVELRHTGENEGVGIVPWDAGSVARFNKGQSWMAVQVADFVLQKAALDSATKEKVTNMPITNLARLVNDPDVRDALGIKAESGSIKGFLPEDEVVKGLTAVVTDVAIGTVTVNRIRTKEQRQEYVEDLVKSGRLASSKTKTVSPWDLAAASPRPPSRRGRPPAATRRTLIPSRCVLSIGHTRIDGIYRELRVLNVERFTNSGAVMLRVFLELSLDEYICTKKVTVPREGRLAQKLSAVADHMERAGVLDRAALKPVRVAASSRDALFSTDTLHAYVHNKHFAPKPSELKITWDNMQPFMEALWP